MANELVNSQEHLHHLTRTDPDARVRHRTQAPLLEAQGRSVAGVVWLFATASHSAPAQKRLASAPPPGEVRP